MKLVVFVFFPVSEKGENGLGDEGDDGGNPPEFLGYNRPWVSCSCVHEQYCSKGLNLT